MALCRFAHSYSSSASSCSTIFRFPKYPSKNVKSSLLPFPFATMEAPPEGYRKNVGICLINNHKKVRSFLFRFRFSLFIHQIFIIIRVLQIFAASRLDIPNAWQMPQVIHFSFTATYLYQFNSKLKSNLSYFQKIIIILWQLERKREKKKNPPKVSNIG